MVIIKVKAIVWTKYGSPDVLQLKGVVLEHEVRSCNITKEIAEYIGVHILQ